MHPALPIELPTEPRRFRVHQPPNAPQDCTFHPDGRMTLQIGDQTLRSWFSMEDMLDMNWADAEIEWDPQGPVEPVAVEPAGAIPLFDAPAA